MPTAFDEAGIRMLDSINEIFEILGFESDCVGFHFAEYKKFNELTTALKNGKCPVIEVLRKYLYSPEDYGSHALVATGIKVENGVEYIQLKNSFADNPNEKGKVHFLYSHLNIRS